MKEIILQYLIDTYDPEAIITYGSYADGSSNEHSDFDALIIAESSSSHDESVVCGVPLDVFIYPRTTFVQGCNAADFVQIHDGIIELDKYGTAERLKETVLQYLERLTPKSSEEIRRQIEWCKKMLLRTERGDAEGAFRWHWLLVDSLEIYFDIIKRPYFGPKKSLKYLLGYDPEASKKYETALKDFRRETLTDWVDYLIELTEREAPAFR